MKLLILSVLLCAAPARAEMREITTLADVVPAISTGTLLVMDIDNTTLEPLGQLGSDQWYYYVIKAYQRDDKLSADDAEAKASVLWTKIQKTLKVKPVETITAGILSAQQKRGVKVMALTARGQEDAEATFAQLKSAGVDFNANPPLRKEIKAPNKGLFKNGVFFQGDGPSKGETLLAFMKANGLKPSRVVFVDDKLKNAASVEKVLREGGVSVLSFRYGATDAKVKFFNDMMDEAGTPAQADLLFRGK